MMARSATEDVGCKVFAFEADIGVGWRERRV